MKYIADILAEVTTWCNHDPIITIRYGALYNWYAVTDARNIANTDWHVPSYVEFQTMLEYIDDYDPINEWYPVAGGKLKRIEFNFWDSPNTGATNEVGFNATAAGLREGGIFDALKEATAFWCSDADIGSVCADVICENISGIAYLINYINPAFKSYGESVRLIKDSTILTNGQTGIYVGNNGKAYTTICIGTQEFVADNLAETKYRDGSDIPIVTDNATWAGLGTGAMCYYNNNITNA